MRNIILTTALLAMGLPTTAFAQEGDPGVESVVFGQRGVTLHEGNLRGRLSLMGSKVAPGIDMGFGMGVAVDYAPIKNLEVGVAADYIGLSPKTDVNAVHLGGR